jgi:hypothetical protein
MSRKSLGARPPAVSSPPVLGQNAKSLDDLLLALKDEYVYNTKVPCNFNLPLI